MKIIIQGSMLSMTLEEQESIWALARSNDVYEQDVNGELWRVLDLTRPEDRNDSIKMSVRDDYRKAKHKTQTGK